MTSSELSGDSTASLPQQTRASDLFICPITSLGFILIAALSKSAIPIKLFMLV